MTKKERMRAVFKREPVDRIPAGDICVSGGFAKNAVGNGYGKGMYDFARDQAVRDYFDMDLIVLGNWPVWESRRGDDGTVYYTNVYGYELYRTEASQHISKPMIEDPSEAWDYPIPDISKVDPSIFREFAEKSDLFIIGQIGGPVSMLDEALDFEDFLVWSLTDTDDLAEAARRIMVYEVQKAKLFIDNGAEAILIADDMAYNSGLFLPPAVMKKLVYPFYKQAVQEIKSYKDVPVIIHSDGNLMEAIDELIDCGFDAMQSLQPSAGMDIYKLKKTIGDKITLWGNLDLDYLMTNGTPEEVAAETRKLFDNMGDTGFILSTCNTLIDPIPIENALAMYREDRHVRK